MTPPLFTCIFISIYKEICFGCLNICVVDKWSWIMHLSQYWSRTVSAQKTRLTAAWLQLWARRCMGSGATGRPWGRILFCCVWFLLVLSWSLFRLLNKSIPLFSKKDCICRSFLLSFCRVEPKTPQNAVAILGLAKTILQDFEGIGFPLVVLHW